MPNRNIEGDYRYKFQGQEKDPETGKEAFQLRLWDGRIGRWLTTDPAGQYNSPYLGMGNNPISRIDPDGGQDCGCDDPPNKVQQFLNGLKNLLTLNPSGKSEQDFVDAENAYGTIKRTHETAEKVGEAQDKMFGWIRSYKT